MPLVKSRPLTPGQRFLIREQDGCLKEKSLRRNLLFQSTKRKVVIVTVVSLHVVVEVVIRSTLPLIDFRRDKIDIPAKVQAIEYDPNRSANIALLAYADGEKRYILAPRGVQAGDTLVSSIRKLNFLWVTVSH